MRRAMRGVHGGLPTVGAVVVGVVVGGALAGGAANLGTPLLGSRGDAGVTPRVAAARSLTALPLDFVENRGQWDPSVVFAARSGAAAAVFRTSRIDLAFSRRPSAPVGLTFDGVSDDASIVGEYRRPGV